jgi:NTP pyrophosphatase (non-canonical NTP hydrolase)
MHFDDYQICAEGTAKYPGQGEFTGLAYAALGLNGEAGETAEKVKKLWRDGGTDVSEKVFDALHGIRLAVEDAHTVDYALHVIEDAEIELKQAFALNMTDERRDAIIKELGDTLWYAAAVATELGVSLSDVAAGNLEKLRDRKDRDVLHGSGDER